MTQPLWRPLFSFQLPAGTVDATTYLFRLPGHASTRANFVVTNDFVGAQADVFQYMVQQRKSLRTQVENFEILTESQERFQGLPAAMQQVQWNAPTQPAIRQIHWYVHLASRGLILTLCCTALQGAFESALPEFEALLLSFRLDGEAR